MEQEKLLYGCTMGLLSDSNTEATGDPVDFITQLLFLLNPAVRSWSWINRLEVIPVRVSKKNVICQLSWLCVRKMFDCVTPGAPQTSEESVNKCAGSKLGSQSSRVRRLWWKLQQGREVRAR